MNNNRHRLIAILPRSAPRPHRRPPRDTYPNAPADDANFEPLMYSFGVCDYGVPSGQAPPLGGPMELVYTRVSVPNHGSAVVLRSGVAFAGVIQRVAPSIPGG